MKKGWIWGILVLLVIIIVIYYYRKQLLGGKAISKSITPDGGEKILTYRLPTDIDPEYFGKYYWAAIHNMASEIPCGSCRYKWETFTKFGHDLVNSRLGKPIFDQKNYDEWMDYIAEVKNEKAEG